MGSKFASLSCSSTRSLRRRTVDSYTIGLELSFFWLSVGDGRRKLYGGGGVRRDFCVRARREQLVRERETRCKPTRRRVTVTRTRRVHDALLRY